MFENTIKMLQKGLDDLDQALSWPVIGVNPKLYEHTQKDDSSVETRLTSAQLSRESESND